MYVTDYLILYEVSVGQRTKTPNYIFIRSFIAFKKYHPDMVEAIQEVTFYIKLACKYNGLFMKSDANIMHLGNDRTSLFFQQNSE